MTHAPDTVRRRRRAGLTFVEVVVCVGIVAGAAVLVFGSIGFLENVAKYNRDRLNGTEVAHRVILQWIDDFQSIKSQVHRVEYGGAMYQYDVWEEVLISESGDDSGTRRKSVRANTVSPTDRMTAKIHQITVVVYAEAPDRTRIEPPVAHLVRSYNPILGLGNRGITYFVQLYSEETGTEPFK